MLTTEPPGRGLENNGNTYPLSDDFELPSLFIISTPAILLSGLPVWPRKDVNNASCRVDMTKMILKAAFKTIQSINLSQESDIL